MGGFTPLVIERFANWKITLVKLGKASCFCQRGGNRASVLTVFENTHFLSGTCTSYVTSLGWGGRDVNVHVNLRHMHI